MSERKGTKGLELWCRKMTEGYSGVKVDNMTTSWRDGLAFCAIIHHFRPDLIEFDKLNKDDIYHNNELAFRVAEHHLGIPALLEPEDMVEFEVPDRLSILTYLSQFYQTFENQRGKSGARIAPKRPQSSTDHGIVSPASTSPPTKVQITIGRARREPCAKCILPVFIAERLNVGKLLYHRTCFRCARCSSQLTLANYYETENGEFCCEICPDEEKKISKKVSPESVLSRSLSDEEKTASLQTYSDKPDAYSTHFETALEYTLDGDLQKNATLTRVESSEFTKARSNFFNSQIENSSESGSEDIPVELPKTKPPPLIKSQYQGEDISFEVPKPKPHIAEKPDNLRTQFSDNSSFPSAKKDYESKTSSVSEQTNDRFVTKDNAASSRPLSVRARMKLFENNKDNKSDVNKFSSSSGNQVPSGSIISKKIATVVAIDDLEDFDNISKKDVDVESSNSGSSILEAHTDIRLMETSEDEQIGSIKETNIDLIQTENDIPSNKQNVDITSEYPSDNSVIDIIDISDEAELSHITIESSVEDNEASKRIDDSIITIEDSPTVAPIQITDTPKTVISEDISFISATSAVSSENDSVPKRGYYTAYEILSPPNTTTSDNDQEVDISADKDSVVVNQSVTTESVKEESVQDQTTPLEADAPTEYPENLNPFEDDDSVASPPPKPLRAFEVAERPISAIPVPASRPKKKIIPSLEEAHITGTPECLASIYVTRISINPFDGDDSDDDLEKGSYNPFEEDAKKEEEEEEVVMRPKKKIMPSTEEQLPKGYNPFGDDDDEEEIETSIKPVPVPTPRLSKATRPEPKPRDTLSITSRGSHGGSNSSISSGSAFGSARKKKPAPRPPMPFKSNDPPSTPSNSLASLSPSVAQSPNLSGTIRSRKTKRAPLPPNSSTPSNYEKRELNDQLVLGISPINFRHNEPPLPEEAPKEKTIKDEENRNRQSQIQANEPDSNLPDKSSAGRWKRRKGQAPTRPIPERRIVKALPISEIKRELDTIEIQQQGLEKQGVRLEQIIREKCEGTDGTNIEDQVPIEVEDLILQLFELVNEKNELFRRQAELMYLRRQQRLEEEYADVEYQIRCLMLQPEANKSDSDKVREETLINRLVEIVERRNEIIECLEMDRRREAEEDNSISSQLNLYSAKRDGDKDSSSPKDDASKKDKKKKLKKLNKIIHPFKHKKEKDHKVDVDKDVDETELNSSSEKGKKKKFNLF